MRVLLDSGIVASGELSVGEYCRVRRLFRWMDKVDARCVIHPLTAEWVRPKIRKYHVLPAAQAASAPTPYFGALLCGGADVFVTEDSLLRPSAECFGLEDRVLSIEQFIRRAAGKAQTPELPIREERFFEIDVSSPFFNSLRGDYPDFDRWFAGKSAQTAHVCRDYDGELLGFLYLKPEDENERYDDVSPTLPPAKRLKLGTFKVSCSGLGLGRRFMLLALDAAQRQGASQLYGTVFSGRSELDAFICFLQKWGFTRHGVKRGEGGEETVMVRDL